MKVIYLQQGNINVHTLNLSPSSIAFGNFDGVHTGHQKVIETAKRVAQEQGIQSGVMTFHPHPKEVLGKIKHSTYLTPLPDKLKQFEQRGVDIALVVNFTLAFSTLSPEQFIQQYIIDLQIQHVITGFDFTFGYKGQGNTKHLHEFSEKTDAFKLYVQSSINEKDEKVSSSRIRQLLHEGHVDKLPSLLNRFYTVSGKVVHGEKRGRTIGFPTANIQCLLSYVLPRNGVYAVLLTANGKRYPGVLNLGVKPTFHKEYHQSIEVHLFDIDLNLYDKQVLIEWVSFIRPEQKFDSIDDLKAQIDLDIHVAKEKLRLIN